MARNRTSPVGTVSNPGPAAVSTTCDRGLPAVPRGQTREMTAYLQSLHNVILSMTGLGRGTAETRAVRVSEQRIVTVEGSGNTESQGKLAAGSVGTAHLADGCVTSEKLATSAVESRNIKPEAVDTATIKSGAVTGEKLADGAVGREKLDPELWPVRLEGTAAHGDTVRLGAWLERPLVILAGDRIPVGDCGELRRGIENLREEEGNWIFEAVAACEFGEADGERFYPGEINWIAIGRKKGGGDDGGSVQD